MNIEGIPAELKQRDRWAGWKPVEGFDKDGKPKVDKRPRGINGFFIDKTDSSKWSTFSKVTAARLKGKYPSIGFMPGDGITVMDLDKCIVNGEVKPEALNIVREMNSFTEISQSGEGLHIFIEADKPLTANTVAYIHEQKIEIYGELSFIAMTGNHLPGTPLRVEKRQQELNEFCNRLFSLDKKKKGSELPAPKSPPMDDDTVLSIAQGAKNGDKFKRLYHSGDYSSYSSQSEADQALCNMLALYTQDPGQIDRLFRSSGLMRDKWDRDDYRDETIRKAITDLTAWYGWQPEDGDKKTQSQLIVELTKGMVFFRTADSETYARLSIHGHFENWKVRSSSFKTLLAKLFYDRHAKVPGGQALSDALNVLDGKALHEGEERKVYLRVAGIEDSIFVDLCNGAWQAIRVTAAGWEIVDNPPVMFKRTKTMMALPIPVEGGSIEQLRPYLNVKDDNDFMLIIAWLLSTFRDCYPFPILTIQGEQGSAKSTVSKVIRSLIDPSTQPLTSFPDNERDMAIKANGTWILAVDNLSGIPSKMSDILCKLSTGGGFSTRKLHTDDEEMIFNAMRPIILNGIDDIAKRADLLDRALVLNLPTIEGKLRKAEREFWEDFESAQPSIFGALLDAAACALKNIQKVKIEDMPRMLDFATWSQAAWQCMGWDWLYGDFMGMYNENRQTATFQGIESDPLASAILHTMEDKKEWSGTTTYVHNELSSQVGYAISLSRAWPPATKLKDRVRRIAPALRAQGITCIELPRSKEGTKIGFFNEKQQKGVGGVGRV